MIFVFENPPHTNISGVDSALVVPSHWRYDLDRYKELGDFFFFGSIETALRLKEIGLGNIFLDDKFDYGEYAKREYAGYFLNRDYQLASVSRINGVSGHNHCNEFGLVFVRPDSFYKLFDGGIYHIQDPVFDEMDEYSVVL